MAVNNIFCLINEIYCYLCDSFKKNRMKKITYLFSLVVLLSNIAISQELFETVHEISGLGYQESFFADIDGDGIEDYVTNHGSSLYWNKHLGNGDFVNQQFLISFETSGIAKPYDFDNDGDIDIIFGNGEYSGFPIMGYTNDGAGNFSDHFTLISSDFLFLQDIYIVDVDGDSVDDVVVKFWQGNVSMGWYKNLGNGYFSTYHTIIGNGFISFNVRFTDIDGDGDIDVFSSQTTYNEPNPFYSTSLYLFNGSSFTEKIIFEDDAHLGFGIDITGDGFQEMIINKGNASVWYENDGENNFSTFELFAPQTIKNIASFDADQDGDMDAFYSYYNDEMSFWAENKNDGTIETHDLIDKKGTFIFTDMDQDNDKDVFINAGSYKAWIENTLDPEYVSENTNSNIKVFPNPTSNSIQFQLVNSANSSSQITIYNQIGLKVFERPFKINKKINVEEWTSGIYFYHISIELENDITGKFIIQH